MSDPVASVEKFVKRREGRPLWVAGWIILAGVTTFAVDTLASLPEQNALVEHDRAVAVRYTQMEAKFDLVDKTIEAMMDSAVSAKKLFDTSIGPSEDLHALEKSSVESSSEVISHARGEVDSMRAIFASLYFGDADVDQMLAGFREDIEAVDEPLRPRDDILRKLRSSEWDAARTQLKSLLESQPALKHKMDTFDLRVYAFDQMTRTKRLEHSADLEGRRVRRSNYQRRLYAMGPAGAYVGLYVMLAWGAWKRDRASHVRRRA